MAAFRAKDYEITQVKRLSVDYLVPAAMLILFLMGVAFIYSTQSYNIEEIPLRRQFWLKQIFYFLFVGLPVYAALGWADYKWVYNCAKIIYAASILLLVPLALKESLDIPIPFVEARYNATRWINLGVFSIQPSELAKIGTCVMAAAMFANHKMGTLKEDWKFWLKLTPTVTRWKVGKSIASMTFSIPMVCGGRRNTTTCGVDIGSGSFPPRRRRKMISMRTSTKTMVPLV